MIFTKPRLVLSPQRVTPGAGQDLRERRQLSCQGAAGTLVRGLADVARLTVRCWLAWRYMRRLGYTRRLAWVMSQR